jgi:hypothetical protein
MPGGKTIAHGLLSLNLTPMFMRAVTGEAEDGPPNGLRVHHHVMIEIEGGKPPACVAGVIGLDYRRSDAKPALQSMM